MAQALGRLLADLKLVAKYHTLDFYFMDLSSLLAAGPVAPPSATFREVQSDEWEKLNCAEGLLPPEEIREQFARGSRLFVVLEAGTVIAMNWTSEKFADLKHINRPRVTFPKGTIYSYGAMVSPAYRKRGIGSFMKQSLLRILHSEGYRLFFAAVFLKKVAPHRWHQANGFKRWGRVTYIDLRVTEFWWTRLTKEGKQYPELFYA